MSNPTIINCKNLNICEKIKAVLDKDMMDFQYRNCVIEMCAKCNEKEVEKYG